MFFLLLFTDSIECCEPNNTQLRIVDFIPYKFYSIQLDYL